MRSLRLGIIGFCAAVALSACGGGGNNNGGGGSPPPPALTITTESILPATLQNHAYSTTLAAANGQGALHWSIAPVSSTALFVTGLTIDANTGTLSGTANFGGTAGFIATVTDSSSAPRSATKGFTVTAYGLLTSAQSQTATVTEFSTFLNNVHAGIQGGFPPVAYSVSSGTMPPGLRFDSTGQLVGSAYQTGSFQFTLAAQDSFSPPETASQPFTITVTAPSLSVQNSLPSRIVVNRPFSGRVVVLGGVPPYTLSSSPPVPAGLSLDPATGVVSGTPTTAGFYSFTIQAKDSSTQSAFAFFNVSIGPPLGRNDTPSTATVISNGSYSASISPYIDPPNGAPFPGDHDYYAIPVVPGATLHVETMAKRTNPTNPLDTVLEIVDGNGIRLNTCRQPGDTSANFTSPCINDDISASPHIQDSALDYQVGGNASGVQTVYAHVFDWRGDARPDMPYTLQVSGAFVPIVVQTTSLAPAAVGNAYGGTIQANGGTGTLTGTISAGQLPPGLQWSVVPGIPFFSANINGTPTTAGTYPFTVQITDQATPPQVVTHDYTIVVSPHLDLANFSVPSLTVGQQYTQQATVSGGVPPYKWSIGAASLTNVSVDASGLVTINPTAAGNYFFNLFVSDSGIQTAVQTVQVTVNP